MLLTRSPLSPGPKAWFSLDLHVLSAPPAFVLSQDQTLREEVIVSRLPMNRQTGSTTCFTLSLSSKCPPHAAREPAERQTGLQFKPPSPKRSRERSRRKCTLLSFQRPRRLPRLRKKASGSTPEAHLFPSSTDVSDSGLMELQCRLEDLPCAASSRRPVEW